MIELSQQARLGRCEPLSPCHHDDDAMSRPDPISNPSFRKLVDTKIRFIAPALGFSLVFIFGTALLFGFDRTLMAEKITGAFNLGYLLILSMYCLGWTIATCYVYVANRRFDSQAQRAIQEVRGEVQS
jgi:uncharacterized membrane protein (DUF485 family)